MDTNDINYLESIDVKYSKQLSFGNLKQILLKCVYPCDTKLKLILVPSINYKHVDDTLTNYINSFIELQQGILVLNNDIKFKLYNNFINVSNYDYIDINTALETFLDKLINSKLKTDYKNNITMDDYNTFDTNFKNLSIEYITINDLLSKPIHKYVFGEALGYYINDDNKDDNVNKHKMIMDKLKQFK